MKGIFISLEGGEGSGKSTQTELLINYFMSKNINCITTREPGGTVICEKIRNLVLDAKLNNMSTEAEMLLFAASRIQLINELILPSLNEGKVIICDRFIDSSFVYQGLTNGDKIDDVKIANHFALNKCMPDITIYFDIDPVDAFKRKNGADENDRMEMKGMEFHQKVRKGFLKLAEMFPERIVKIDASKSVQEVHEQILQALKNKGIISEE